MTCLRPFLAGDAEFWHVACFDSVFSEKWFRNQIEKVYLSTFSQQINVLNDLVLAAGISVLRRCILYSYRTYVLVFGICISITHKYRIYVCKWNR